jgi:hypothetical protein
MACRGVYFALTPEQEQRLLACRTDRELTDVVVEEIEEEWDDEYE